MAASTSPIFLKEPSVQWASSGLAANTALDGTGTVALLFTADATNGSKVERIKVRSTGTNVATVLRVFVNNGSTNATAANNSLVVEQTIAANSLSQVAASTDYDIAVNIPLPAGYKLNITIGTAIASALSVTAIGGHY